MERSTPEKDLGVAPQSTPEHQSSVADLKFVELYVFLYRRFGAFQKGTRNLSRVSDPLNRGKVINQAD